MFELLRALIAIVGSSFAGLYDLKTTNIPDSVAVAMIVIGFGIHTYEGLITSDYTNLINASIFSFIFFLFSFIMYKLGQWGGGDGELLIGVVALLPTYPSIQTIFPFSISFFINTFFVGMAYSLAFIFFYVWRDKAMRKNLGKNFLLILRKGVYRRIPTSKLKVDDMLGENIKQLKLSQRVLRGLTLEEVKKIRNLKRYVIIKEGVRYGPVFPLALLITLIYGDIVLLFV